MPPRVRDGPRKFIRRFGETTARSSQIFERGQRCLQASIMKDREGTIRSYQSHPYTSQVSWRSTSRSRSSAARLGCPGERRCTHRQLFPLPSTRDGMVNLRAVAQGKTKNVAPRGEGRGKPIAPVGKLSLYSRRQDRGPCTPIQSSRESNHGPAIVGGTPLRDLPGQRAVATGANPTPRRPDASEHAKQHDSE